MERTHGIGSGHASGCFGCKLLSVQFGRVNPTLGTLKDRAFEKDGPAYLALRNQGYQPRSVRGSYELQTRAKTALEVETGKLIAPELHKEYVPAINEARQYLRENKTPVETIREWKDAKRKGSGQHKEGVSA